MKICRTVADMRQAVAGLRAGGASVGLVTTMGALHPGHLSLVAEAKGLYDRVVTTIFVNPTQFGNRKDIETYPRTEADDLARFEAAGVAACFVPEVAVIYPEGDETIVETIRLAGLFHGAVRPGHFRGVATVVTKLFNIVGADGAFFGEKDYQQLAVIRQMVRDLHMPIRVHGVATMREPDGLAMSSRNVRLATEDRAAAPVLVRALDAAEAMAQAGATVEDLAATTRDVVGAEPRARLKGLDIVDAERFLPATGPIRRRIGIMISAEFGPPGSEVLLIDQREIAPPPGG